MKLQLMALRRNAGFSNRDDFAKALGVSESRYKSWETESRRLPITDACKIADFLGCSLDELAGRDWAPSEYSDERQARINEAYESSDEEARADIYRAARNARAASEGRAGGSEEEGSPPPGAMSA